MKRYTDLSGTLENGLWGYDVLPGLENIIPPVSIKTLATVEKDEFFASQITFSTISGTYLEAGSHILEDGKTLDQYSVSDFIKPVSIIRLPKLEPKTLITADLLEAAAGAGSLEAKAPLQKGDAVIIDTGWGGRWNQEGYVLECPTLHRSAVEWVLNYNISIFGIDVPCIESSWSEDDAEEKGGLLGMLFQRNVLLVAPLVNLDRVKGDRGVLMCLPLAVAGTSGAPARIVLEEEI